MKTNSEDCVIYKMNDEYGFLTKELLEKEYVVNKLNDREIAEKYNVVSKIAVWKRRKFFKIPSRGYERKSNSVHAGRKFSINIDEAKSWLDTGMSYIDIATKMECSRIVAYRRLKECGLIQDREKSLSGLKMDEPISELQLKFLLGCVLGDGGINRDGMFQCNHSHKQFDYIAYKMDILKNLFSPLFELKKRTVHNNQNGKDYESYFIRTMANNKIREIEKEFYKEKSKIFPYEYLMKSNFDNYSLAIWFMDDGSKSGNRAILYTNSFGYDGNIDVVRFLKNRFGLDATICENLSQKSDFRWFINFDLENSSMLFNLIRPYILPCFNYKIPKTI